MPSLKTASSIRTGWPGVVFIAAVYHWLPECEQRILPNRSVEATTSNYPYLAGEAWQQRLFTLSLHLPCRPSCQHRIYATFRITAVLIFSASPASQKPVCAQDRHLKTLCPLWS